MRTEGTRVCRRFAFLIFCRPGAIEMEPVPPPVAIRRDRVRRFWFFVASWSKKLGRHAPQDRIVLRHCERSEAIQLCVQRWIASSLALLAMTGANVPQERIGLRHCERSEAIQLCAQRWIASSLTLLAMTGGRATSHEQSN
jgi:hypothetical protein